MSAEGKTVQRSFLLPSDQAEWLREHASRTRRTQAEIVREAIAEYQSRSRSSSEPEPGRGRNHAIVSRFSRGDGIDLELLRDGDQRIWRLDG